MDQRAERVNGLISEIAAGKKQALNILYDETGGLLFIMAKKYLFDKSKAEDVVGEVFLQLVKSAKSFKKGHNGLNWLFKIVRNEALDTNKRDGQSSAENIDDFPDIRDALEFEEKTVNGIALKDALEKLSGTERAALYHKFWEGLTVRETAKAMKVPRSTAQDIINGALKKLGELLKQN